MVVSGEQSDTISSYVIDSETGALKPIGRYPTGKGANWVEIVAFYSITSSAVASSVEGISRPSTFAVLRLITSSNLVGS